MNRIICVNFTCLQETLTLSLKGFDIVYNLYWPGAHLFSNILISTIDYRVAYNEITCLNYHPMLE